MWTWASVWLINIHVHTGRWPTVEEVVSAWTHGVYRTDYDTVSYIVNIIA